MNDRSVKEDLIGISASDNKQECTLKNELSGEGRTQRVDILSRQVIADCSYSESSLDSDAERKLLRKLDWNLMPMIMMLFLASFLDRSNIGNAAAAGMSEDLGLKGSQLNIATSVFFITYIMGETPFAIALRIIGPSTLIPTIVIIWSCITIGTAFCKNFAQLIACRLLLGVAESGLFPCLTLYFGQFYYRNEQAKRTAFLFSATALSGAVNGLLSYGLVQIKHTALKSWQWLFLVEGLLSLIVGISAIFFLPDRVEKARFLSEGEKDLALARRQRAEIWAAIGQDFDWSEVRKALSDPKVYLSSMSQFGMDVALYGFGTFLPVIIKSLGFNTLHAYLLTIPVFILGLAVFLTCAVLADRMQRRMLFILISAPVTAIGFAILNASGLSTGVYFFACFLVAAGMYTTIGLNVVMLNINQAGHFKRAAALGIQQSIGNSSGVLAGQLYRSKWAPHYHAGHAISLGATLFCIVGAICHGLFLYRENKRRDNLSSEQVQRLLSQGGGENQMGDSAPTWRYVF